MFLVSMWHAYCLLQPISSAILSHDRKERIFSKVLTCTHARNKSPLSRHDFKLLIYDFNQYFNQLSPEVLFKSFKRGRRIWSIFVPFINIGFMKVRWTLHLQPLKNSKLFLWVYRYDSILSKKTERYVVPVDFGLFSVTSSQSHLERHSWCFTPDGALQC